MAILKSLGILALLLLLVIFYSYANKKPEGYREVSSQVADNVGLEISKKYNLDLYGTGGSAIYNLRHISQNFMGDIPTGIKELRELYLEIAAEYIKAFNANHEISPYYNTQPFDLRMLDLTLQNEKWEEINDPSTVVYVLRRKYPASIVFKARTLEGGFQELYSETIEEALAKVSPKTRQKYLEAITIHDE